MRRVGVGAFNEISERYKFVSDDAEKGLGIVVQPFSFTKQFITIALFLRVYFKA